MTFLTSSSTTLGNDDGNDNKTSTLSDHFDNALEYVKNFFGSTPAPADTITPPNLTKGGRKSRKGKSRKCSKCTRARKCARCRKSSRR